MLNKVKNLANTQEKKRLLSNFLSLAILQGANYILPLLTLPYLVRVLGVEYFGILSFATAMIVYFNVLVDYGFNLTATREISIHRNNKEKVIEIFSSVMSIKFILLVISFILLILLVFNVQKFSQHADIYIYTFGTVIGQMLFPVWFFQGMEKMKYITYLNIVSKLFFTIAIFIFVQEQSDFYIVPIVTSIGFIVAGILALIVIYRDFGITFTLQKVSTLKIYLYDGWHLFSSGLFTMFYVNSPIVILGLFTNNTVVGYYTLADKVVKIVSSIFTPVQDALYPYIVKKLERSKQNTLDILRRLLLYSSTIMFIVSVFIFLCAEYIIVLISGEKIEEAVEILRILAFFPFIITIARIYATNYIITFKLEKYLPKVYAQTAVVSAFIFAFLIPLYEGIGAALAIMLIEAFATLYMYFIVKQKITLTKENNE